MAIASCGGQATAVGVAATFHRCDAASLPVADAVVDAVASNPPWGRRISASGRLRRGFDPLWRELARALKPGGRAALLMPPVDLPQVGALALEERFGVHVFGAGVQVTVLVSNRTSPA